jgi:hypothetical protein
MSKALENTSEPTENRPSADPLTVRWRPEQQPANATAMRNHKHQNGPTKMGQTARKMLGLMSVMMAGRVAGPNKPTFDSQNPDIQTGLNGNILLKPGTNIAVRTVGRSRLSKLGCVCPCKCGALPSFVAGGRVYIKDQHIANAPVWMRDYLIDQSTFIDCISNCDVCTHWNIPANLTSGIHAYLQIAPTEYTYKLGLKRVKIGKMLEAANGELENMPKPDQELDELVSSDEVSAEDESQIWISPVIKQAELCIWFCRCDGAPVVTARRYLSSKRRLRDPGRTALPFISWRPSKMAIHLSLVTK